MTPISMDVSEPQHEKVLEISKEIESRVVSRIGPRSLVDDVLFLTNRNGEKPATFGRILPK
jgi:hypothetical protein